MVTRYLHTSGRRGLFSLFFFSPENHQILFRNTIPPPLVQQPQMFVFNRGRRGSPKTANVCLRPGWVVVRQRGGGQPWSADNWSHVGCVAFFFGCFRPPLLAIFGHFDDDFRPFLASLWQLSGRPIATILHNYIKFYSF